MQAALPVPSCLHPVRSVRSHAMARTSGTDVSKLTDDELRMHIADRALQIYEEAACLERRSVDRQQLEFDLGSLHVLGIKYHDRLVAGR